MSKERPRARRRPRFKRSASAGVRLTPDDLTVIMAVGRHRFLRSTHLVRLLPSRSPQKVLERLAELYHAGYLDRPRAQINYFARSGSPPIVYALGNRGADIYFETCGKSPPANDWTDKNRAAKRPYIEHALLLAELMLPLELAKIHGVPSSLLDANALLALAPMKTRRRSLPWKLTARVWIEGMPRSISAIPDAVFALRYAGAQQNACFFVEADRATMPISRIDPRQSSFASKLLAYYHAHRARLHSDQLNFPNLRVLIITTSTQRVASMLDAVNAITDGKGSGMFLFIDAATLARHGGPLGAPWMTTRGIVRIDVPPKLPGSHFQ